MHSSKAKISIIIPVLNEAGIIAKTINSTQTGQNIEIIVSDGGSADSTAEIAKKAGAKVINSPKGRALQMNAGVSIATGEILLFLHADTVLSPGYDSMIRQALQQTQTVAGAFELQIDGLHPGLRMVETAVNWRSRWLQMPYGDQAIFMPTQLFKQLGGFPEMPIMEDFAMIQKLQRQGKINIVKLPVLTSDRRWHKNGILKTTAINQLVILGYFLGVPPASLADWYRHL
ncbi:TIGR04283 family arsenosugar biosynthesis glycosyltransferase [Ancylothrix sp. C2]|uniref:TIGR04283 family arsenosugar biosynthesis glycosyltransferase n=1 Tax=Ancylothrix sp. D3o TaxID=2953691 RepID=UPI0021BB2946|nr:TIGR04283 family arsenosugar biosynthesis glycosyltransferase [Ancylothrix sp. D3o]MCT7952050.1 TIGR04283 family arsenosugar biosynthesis glycosyltransferase [Ancylothrix sp. D3o]